MNVNASSIIETSKHLDFNLCNEDYLKQELIADGEDGEYTLCDEYNDAGLKLYELLIYYPEDELSEKRNLIYMYCKENINNILNINTGGWCL